MALLLELIKKLVISLIHVYQFIISPILGHRCRFDVTCSQYSINSINKFGILKGSWKTCTRILRCHPLTVSNKRDFYFFRHVNIKDVLNMDLKRNFFFIALLMVSFVLWQLWDTERSIVSHPSFVEERITDNNYNNHHMYDQHISGAIKNSNISNNQQSNINYNNFITVKTDIFLLKINLYGGDIEEAYLVKYLEDLNSKKPFHLLENSKLFKYQMHSGFINEYKLNDLDHLDSLFYVNKSNQSERIMLDHENELQLTLVCKDYNGVLFTKRYVFKRNDYSIYIYYTINNTSMNSINVQLFGDLVQTVDISQSSSKTHHEEKFPLYSYRGAAYSTNKEKYHKYSFKEIQRTNLNVHTTNGWIAMLQKFFVTAWLPLVPKNNTFYSLYNVDDQNVTIGFKSDSICVPSDKTVELESILWVGPKIQADMQLINPTLDLVIDYGWLWFISQPLFKLLQFIYSYIGNWGISIILITLIIRLIMYPLTKAQYTSMAKIRMLQPKVALIQEEYKHDKYQYHQKTIALYRSEKVNPLGGCLPLLIQMPIFLALYYMLSGSIELRHAKFAFWIDDLSSKDPYYILPIIMGITMFLIQKLSPTTITDPMQKRIMTTMLMIFTVFFLWFPSGLVLYYIVSNVITIVQQQVIYHGLSKRGLSNKKKLFK